MQSQVGAIEVPLTSKHQMIGIHHLMNTLGAIQKELLTHSPRMERTNDRAVDHSDEDHKTTLSNSDVASSGQIRSLRKIRADSLQTKPRAVSRHLLTNIHTQRTQPLTPELRHLCRLRHHVSPNHRLIEQSMDVTVRDAITYLPCTFLAHDKLAVLVGEVRSGVTAGATQLLGALPNQVAHLRRRKRRSLHHHRRAQPRPQQLQLYPLPARSWKRELCRASRCDYKNSRECHETNNVKLLKSCLSSGTQTKIPNEERKRLAYFNGYRTVVKRYLDSEARGKRDIDVVLQCDSHT
mmetsp:Transcript_35562/g.55264  ORF Transcript_35562/g.55264 Transcript_35562/m.55264 type:complete len:294 (+) Transcript_35562:826-1707(+)